MNRYLISMFIDDELRLDDKIEFVKNVHEHEQYKDEAVELLEQEKIIRADVPAPFPRPEIMPEKRKVIRLFRPAAFVAAAAVLGMFALLFLKGPAEISTIPYRFVIYQPEVAQAEIVGSFTDWKGISMKKVGSSGYWSLTLDIPRGEHRFTYMLEGERRIPDPTIMARERDDFGGGNSILYVGSET